MATVEELEKEVKRLRAIIEHLGENPDLPLESFVKASSEAATEHDIGMSPEILYSNFMILRKDYDFCNEDYYPFSNGPGYRIIFSEPFDELESPCSWNASQEKVDYVFSLFAKVSHVKSIDLACYPASFLPQDFSQFPELENLSLAGKRQSEKIPKEKFRNILSTLPKTLRALNLTDCGMDSFPKEILHLENLSYLNITDNEIFGRDWDDRKKNKKIL